MDWLEIYDKYAEVIDDDILDEADELFNIGIDPGQTLSIPDEYYIWVAQQYKERTNELHNHFT